MIAWDCRTGEQSWLVHNTRQEGNMSVDFSHSKQYYLCCVGYDGVVSILDTKNSAAPSLCKHTGNTATGCDGSGIPPSMTSCSYLLASDRRAINLIISSMAGQPLQRAVHGPGEAGGQIFSVMLKGFGSLIYLVREEGSELK
eukprot:GFUD01060651.1.p1 GENE.GFUD01060651.1~~GFUD01060651.1.p1  ORF type:complete len:142 (+),score=34.71 GFUD01060651.1:174-599(+)